MRIVVALTLLMAGCVAGPGTPELSCGDREPFINAELGVGYCHDPTWTRSEPDGDVTFQAPGDRIALASLMWSDVPSGWKADDYGESNLADLRESATRFQMVSSTQGTVCGVPSMQVEYSMTTRHDWYAFQTFYVREGRGHLMSLLVELGSEETFRAEAAQILGSVRCA